MKSILLVTTIALAIGVWQRQAIHAVRQEAMLLDQPTVAPLETDAVSETQGSRSSQQEVRDIETRQAIFSFFETLIAEEKLHGRANANESLPKLVELLSKLSSKGREELLTELQNQSWSDEAKGSLRFVILQSWAAEDPLAAATAALQWHESASQQDEMTPALMAVVLVTKAWLKKDPATALAWIEAETPLEDQPAMVREEFEHMIAAAKFHAQPNKLLHELVEAPAHQRSTIMAAAVKRMNSPEERLAFAREFTNKTTTDPSLEVLQMPVAQALLQQVFQGSSPQTEEMDEVLDLIPLDSPEKFLAQATLTTLNEGTADRMTWLVNRYGDHPEVRRAIAGRFAIWAQKDHRAAATWLQTLESSPLKDEGISRFAQSIIYAEPESAVDWATTISGEALRNKVLGKLHQAWYNKDAAAAEAYFEAHHLQTP